jgi:hypothetical protein
VLSGVTAIVKVAHVRLCHSRMLFVRTYPREAQEIYEVGLLDEFSVNAYWSEHNHDSLDASLKLLGTGKLSTADTRRVVANARFASDRLPRNPNPESLGIEDFVEQRDLLPAWG